MKPPNGCCMLVHHALALSLLVQLKQLVIRSCKIHQSLREKKKSQRNGESLFWYPSKQRSIVQPSEQMIPLFSALRMSKQGSKWYLGGKNPPLLLSFLKFYCG